MTKPFVLYRNTKSRTDYEREEEVMSQMEDDSEAIDFEEFANNCEFDEVAAQLGYNDDLPLAEDWSVSFSKSQFGGLPCFILGHTECDFIFLKPEDARMLAKFHGKSGLGMTDKEWERRTHYGKSGIDRE